MLLNWSRNTVDKYASTPLPKFDEIQAGLGLDAEEVELPPEVDGILAERTILVNSRIKNEERKQFTRFHEVTHHLINEDGELISEIHDATLNQEGEYKRQLERLCNIGAAEFLMPSRQFRKLHKELEFNVNAIPLASSHFGASAIATTIHLHNLHQIPAFPLSANMERPLIERRQLKKTLLRRRVPRSSQRYT